MAVNDLALARTVKLFDEVVDLKIRKSNIQLVH